MKNISRRSFVTTLGSLLTVVTGAKAFGTTKPVHPKKKTAKAKPKAPAHPAPAFSAVQVNNKPVSLQEIPVGESLAAIYVDPKTHGEKSIVLHRIDTTSVVAFSAICTHRGCTVAFSTPVSFDCPCHGSSYNSQTGAVIAGPAPRALTPLKVKDQNGELFVA